MDELRVKVGKNIGSESLNLSSAFKDNIFIKKITNPLGFILLTILCIALGTVIIYEGLTAVIIILVALIGLPVAYGIMFFPRFGIITLLISAYFIMWFTHMGFNYPFGTVIDIIELLLIVGFFIKQKKHPNWGIFKSSISVLILIWIAYNILQIANPIIESRLAWLYTIRSVAAVMIMYFVFVYHIRSAEFIKLLIKIWIGLTIIGAAYGFWQEFIGFLPFEENFINSDPKYRNLLFIAGKWRKFSIYSDPVAFSYNMVISTVLCVTMMLNQMKLWKKVTLGALAFFFIWAMIFSGTRGAYVLIPAALALLVILKFNRTVLLFAFTGFLLLAFFIYVPTSNYNIRRFQSAFNPSKDASFSVRAINQKRIQPFIQEHPLGAGLGAVSSTGKQMVRHSVLTGFAPDSGYVRVAVELGWIGLLLFCTLLFGIVRSGINNYFKIRDPELQNYCLAMTLIAFILAIGSYPQEAIVQFPTSIYFYLVVAIITITRQLDEKNYPKEKLPVKRLI